MKPKLIIIIMVAIIATACSTNLQTTGSYVDDIYYWPGDALPEIASEDLTALQNGTESNNNLIIVSELETGKDGSKTLNNYIYADEEPDWFNEVQAYNIENMTDQNNDTVFIPSDDATQYIVNNYYIDDDYSYAERIRRFHNPHYYSADPYWNMNFAWGYRPYGYMGYSSMYWNPWHYGGFYGDYYSGFYGYNSFYSPWYSSWYSPYYSSCYSYYPGYYGYNHYYPGNSYQKKDYYKGERRSSRPNTTYAGAGVGRSSVSDNNGRSNQIVNKSATTDNRRSVVNRDDMSASAQKSVTTRTAPDNTILTEKRRSTVSTDAVRTDSPTRGQTNVNTPDASRTASPTYNTRTPSSTRSTYSVPATKSTTGTREYTPSYNTPRTNTRATYNRSNTTQPTQGTPTQTRSSSASSGSSTRSYTIPSTGSTSRSSGTTSQSSSTTTTRPSSYSSGSSSSPSRSTYTPSRSSSSTPSSSTPSSSSTRSSSSSYSSPSYSGGSSSPSRSSGGSSSGSSSSFGGSSSSGSRR